MQRGAHERQGIIRFGKVKKIGFGHWDLVRVSNRETLWLWEQTKKSGKGDLVLKSSNAWD